MNIEERPQIPEESQKTSLEEAQEVPEEIESESPGCDGSDSHKWANKMEVQRRLSDKPDLEILEKRTVLFVDDDEAMLRSLERGLLDESYNKLFTKSSKEALEILRCEDVHIIVTDMRMPEMTGLELLRITRKEYPNIIGIVITGYELDAELQKAVDHREVFRLVAKPLWKLGGKLEKLIRWSLDNYNLQLTR